MCNVVLAAVEDRGDVTQVIRPVILVMLVMCRTTESGCVPWIKVLVLLWVSWLDLVAVLPSTLLRLLANAGLGKTVPIAILAFVRCPVKLRDIVRPVSPAMLQPTTLVGTVMLDLEDRKTIWF